jgi:hypothetical protein
MGLVYFYCDGSQQEKQNPRIILGSVLRQLVEHPNISPRCSEIKALKKFYENNKNGTFQTKTKLESLVSHILAVSKMFDRVFIIIDGLDECHSRENLLEMITKLTDGVHVLVTSRREADIQAKFVSQPALAMKEEAVQADIKAHVEDRLKNGGRLKDLRPVTKEEIKQKLLEKSGGMYNSIFVLSMSD